MQMLAISDIRTDGGTQPRAEISDEIVAEYAEAMRQGAEFPPVAVFHDGSDYWLGDGFHRVRAATAAGSSRIAADIRQGTQRDARWHSFGANKAHGVRRSRGDARRAIEAILSDAEWERVPQAQIAAHVGVTASYVSQVKATMKDLIVGTRGDRVRCRDGRMMDTARIGKAAPAATGPRRRPGGLSRYAFKPVRGHSNPPPMVPLSLPRNNPEISANTLIDLFDADWLRRLVERIANHLDSTSPQTSEGADA